MIPISSTDGAILPPGASECRYAELLLPLLSMDELEGKQREATLHHLASCRACQSLLDRYKQEEQVLRRQLRPQTPPFSPFSFEDIAAAAQRADRPPVRLLQATADSFDDPLESDAPALSGFASAFLGALPAIEVSSSQAPVRGERKRPSSRKSSARRRRPALPDNVDNMDNVAPTPSRRWTQYTSRISVASLPPKDERA